MDGNGAPTSYKEITGNLKVRTTDQSVEKETNFEK